MDRHFFRGGLRAQLALTIALVTALGIAGSFLALYSGTSSRLRAQIEAQLRTQNAEWHQFAAAADISTRAGLAGTARRFIADQRYHAEALIIVVQVDGGPTLSNNTGVVASEEARERRQPERPGLLDANLGFSDVAVATAGDMRLLSERIAANNRRVGTIRFANPLAPVRTAQASLRRTFVVVGVLALVLAAGAGMIMATLIAAPLRRIAAVAAAVNAGDLSSRAGSVRTSGEVRVLADAFDRMLERLERTFRRQRDFVSDASHELRTPLAVIRAQVELLERETDEAKRREGTRTLLRRLDELNRLVGDMLTLASAEGGELVKPRRIELTEYFEDLRRDLPLFGDRDYTVQAIDGTLTADPDRLTQVMRNLVRNAVAHTRNGDRITVSAEAIDGVVQITVSDTGAGMAHEELEHIFERFYRADRARGRDRGGGGLGLAIARAIIEAHGGRISADSSPGRGATFVLRLPGYMRPADAE